MSFLVFFKWKKYGVGNLAYTNFDGADVQSMLCLTPVEDIRKYPFKKYENYPFRTALMFKSRRDSFEVIT